MFTNLQSYHLALDIFALTALAMAATATPGRTKTERSHYLLALITLVLVRSLALIMNLTLTDIPAQTMGAVELLSIYCVVWMLRKPSASYSNALRLYMRLGIIAIPVAILLAFWLVTTLPWQPVAVLIAAGGLPLIFSLQDKPRWGHTLPPILLSLAALLNWAHYNNIGYLVALMSYGALLYAVFVEAAISAGLKQQTVESLVVESRRVHSERLRSMEIGSTLIATRHPIEMLQHAVQTIARATGVDQVVILSLSAQPNAGNVVAAYSQNGAIHHTVTDNTPFNPQEVSLLVEARESQQHLLVAEVMDLLPELGRLYRLWDEPGAGPTLLQPLLLDQKVVGFLVMGNPTSGRTLSNTEIRLGQTLAPQLAGMIIYQNQYFELQSQAEDLAARFQFAQGQVEQLTDIVESISDGVLVSDLDGKINLVNQAAQQILGKTTRQLIGKPIGAIYGDIDSTDSIEKLASEFSRNDQPISTFFENEGRSVQGRLIPLRNSRQEWLGFVALLRDVTPEAQAEKSRREFVRTISRELRTPLTTARGFLDMVFAGPQQEPNLQQNHFMDIIRTNLDRMIEIVNNATLVVDYETNAVKLDMMPVNVREIIDSAVKNISTQPTAIGKTRFVADVDPDLPNIQADPSKLRQALDILLSNASRFTKSTDRQVSLRVWVQSEGVNGQTNNHLIISIASNGVGLPPEIQKRAFESSSSYDDELSQLVGNKGFRLPKVKEIIEAHGGRVWLENLEGAGSVFHITLPYARP